MIFLKSIIAGIVAVFAVTALLLASIIVYLIVYMWRRPDGNAAVGWDVISLVKPSTLVAIAVIFLIGFFWKFVQISKR